jgi:Mrp family chromosome partitioning ATPase
LKVVAVTSAERQEGRTTVALALARSAAAAGCRVALLDADCANPELARRLGLDAPCDWQQVRRHHQPLHEAAIASLDDRVTLFPLTVPDDDLSGRLDDPTLTGVLQELKRAFDLVVVDTQPVTEGDTRVAAATGPCEVDMVLVVRNVQTTAPETCLSRVARLRAMGIRAVGLVENFAPAEEAAV